MDKAARLVKRQFMMKQSSSAAVCNGGKLNDSTNQDNSDMGGESQGEEEEEEELQVQPRRPSSRNKLNNKKLKLHASKSIIDRNAVDHANVPRKLRSAMSKRSRESLSPPLSHIKKPRHSSVGMEAPRSNTANKSKEKSKQEGEADKIVSGPITKDEEEVAETLFSLARMLPEDKPNGSRVDRQTSDEKPSPLKDTKESPQLATQAPKEASTPSQLTCSAAGLTNLSSNFEGSSKQSSLSELTIMGRPIQYGNTSTAIADLLRTALPSRGANTVAIPLADPSELCVSPELCHVTGSVESVQCDFSRREQKLNHGFWAAPNDREKEEPQQPVSLQKGSGTFIACIEGAPYLWPGTHRMQSCGGEVLRSPSTKLPPWLESASPSTRTGSTETSILTEQVKPMIVDLSKSFKRCAAHVYISRIIQAHQDAEKKSRWPVLPGHLKINERMTSPSDLNGLRNGPHSVVSAEGAHAPNGVTSTASTYLSALGKSPSELKTGNLQERRLHRDQQIPISTSGTYSSEKKSCDLLCSSAGGGNGGQEPSATTTSDSYQGGIGLVSSAQGHVAYLNPFVQHHPLMSLSLSHVRGASPQSQLSQYMNGPYYYPAHPGHIGPTKQQLEQQQHQAWAAQLASQYNRPGGNSGTTPLPRWQNGIHDSPSLAPYAQPSSSSPPMELLSTKGSQQQLFALSSCMGKLEHHPVPRSYADGGRGLQSDASPHLQLVCSAEHM